MDEYSPFDSSPDRELGDRLREALTPAGQADFVARVLRRLPEPGSFWDVLESWARPGVAAAILVAALLGWWLAPRMGASPSPSPAEVLASEQPLRDAMPGELLGSGR
ncbi:MAG: hypothetical protein U0133_19750 [Gemmatimonadales bacterium]